MTSRNMQGVRTIVSGGAGFIGSEVTRQLLEEGALVTVFDNFTSGKEEYLAGLPARTVRGDICDKEKVASHLSNRSNK